MRETLRNPVIQNLVQIHSSREITEKNNRRKYACAHLQVRGGSLHCAGPEYQTNGPAERILRN
jgi:hypothetical protein